MLTSGQIANGCLVGSCSFVIFVSVPACLPTGQRVAPDSYREKHGGAPTQSLSQDRLGNFFYMKTYLTFLVLFIGIACYGQEVVEIDMQLDSDEIESLNKDAVQELSEIVLNYYDSWILDKTGLDNVEKAYHSFYDSVLQSEDHIQFMQMLKMNQKELDSLIVLCVEKGLFTSVWFISPMLPVSEKKSYMSHQLMYNTDALYWQFIKTESKNNKSIKDYRKKIETVGDITPIMKFSFPSTHKNYDFSKDSNRLIFAIHFITVSYEQYYKKINL